MDCLLQAQPLPCWVAVIGMICKNQWEGGPSDGIMGRDGWAPVTVEFACNLVLAQSSAWELG